MYLTRFKLSLFLFTLLFVTMNIQAKNVYGLYEDIHFQELGNVIIKAKLDTGALTSSFGASDIDFFDKNGQEWVKFKPQINDLDLPVIEKEIIRYSKIKTRHDDLRNGDDLPHSKRPVVMMDICFDGNYYEIEVNLTDRSRFNYPLLLGRSALIKFNAVIDPGLRFRSKAQCSL